MSEGYGVGCVRIYSEVMGILLFCLRWVYTYVSFLSRGVAVWESLFAFVFLCYRYTNHQSSGWVDFFMGFSWRYASSLSLDLSPMRFLELCSNNAVHGASFEFQDILLLFWVPDLTILRKRRIPRLFRIKLARFEIEPVGLNMGTGQLRITLEWSLRPL